MPAISEGYSRRVQEKKENSINIYIHACILGRKYFVERTIHLIEEQKLPDECGPTISDHTKQYCRNKRSMITPEA